MALVQKTDYCGIASGYTVVLTRETAETLIQTNRVLVFCKH
ncbi:MAG: hypothetical protein ACFFFH_02500 [Candidatus Thorarchaeota archaeon]